MSERRRRWPSVRGLLNPGGACGSSLRAPLRPWNVELAFVPQIGLGIPASLGALVRGLPAAITGVP